MGVVDATAAQSYNPSKLSDTTRYAPKCQRALLVALGAMVVISVASCGGLTQSLSKCGEFVRENKMGMQSFPSARRLGLTLFGNAPNSEAPSYQKFVESIPDELETVISFGNEVKGDSERWNLRIQDYLPTFRGAQSLAAHADKFMWVRSIKDWCRRGYSQLRLVIATAACYVTFSVMAVDSRGKPVHKMGVFAWTEMLIPAWTIYLLTPLLAGLCAFGAVEDPETGELYELRIFHSVVGVSVARSILVLTWTIMAGTVVAAVAACKAIIENYVARNSRGPPVNEGVEATQPLSHDEQLGRRKLAAKAEKNDELFIEMHGKELFEVKKEVMTKHGYAAWLSVRHFIEENGIAAWREEKKRFSELGFERWRVGRRLSYVEALHERVGKGDVGAAIKLAQMHGAGQTRQPLKALAASADAAVSSKAQAALEALRRADRIKAARRSSAVLAALTASDPDDKYVQQAHDESLRAALVAMVKEGDEEEKSVAQVALEALRRADRIQAMRRCSAVLAARAARDPDDKYVQQAHDVGLQGALGALVSDREAFAGACEDEEEIAAQDEANAARDELDELRRQGAAQKRRFGSPAYDLAVGARIALRSYQGHTDGVAGLYDGGRSRKCYADFPVIEVVGRTGVVASHPEFMAKWWKVRLDGEEALRNVYRSDLLALDEDVEAAAALVRLRRAPTSMLVKFKLSGATVAVREL